VRLLLFFFLSWGLENAREYMWKEVKTLFF